MRRRTVLLVSFALIAGCGRTGPNFEEVLPRELPGGWTRGELRRAAEMPSAASQLGGDEASTTTYTGPGAVRVTAVRMPAETSAFELMQKWRQTDGLAAYKGRFFFVAVPDGTAPDAAKALLRALQDRVD